MDLDAKIGDERFLVQDVSSDEGNGILLNGKEFGQIELIQKDDSYQIKVIDVDSTEDVYEAELISVDSYNKLLNIKIEGVLFEIQLKDSFDRLVEKMGIGSVAETNEGELKAPMPGLVLNVEVEVGQKVEKGDPLLVLVAMKMENVLKSPSEGTIKNIHVAKDQSVAKNELLITFE